MDQYLFLYPITPYIEAEAKCSPRIHIPNFLEKLTEVIDARYRSQGYGINWLTFDNGNGPDMDLLTEYIDFNGDGILVADISFKDSISTKNIYSDSYYILDQLPEHERLVLGGFHQYDCVDKVAQSSYERGVDTFVDEDTTDMFFVRHAFGSIPLIRPPEELTIEVLCKAQKDDLYYKFIVKNRKDKPWFVQS